MISELINFNHHKNEIALYRNIISNKIFYKKVSFSSNANKTIETEYHGYNWFFSKTGYINNVKLIIAPFFELIVPEFSGRKFKSTSNLCDNKEIIWRILDFYILHWNPYDNIKMKIHGDFALGNFVVNNNEIYLIDWEHSHDSESNFWAFDFIHLLFIALQYQSFKISYKEKQFIRNCYRKLIDIAPKTNMILEKPFQYSSKYMNEYNERFSLNKPIQKKFDLANFSKFRLDKLDLIIT